MEDCLFCKIAAGDIPSKKLYEDEQVVAFYDIAPQAKVHFLVIPKKHIPSAAALTEEDGANGIGRPRYTVRRAIDFLSQVGGMHLKDREIIMEVVRRFGGAS